MRVLNFGQVLIPSGLIHDVFLELSGGSSYGLTHVFNTFLKNNNLDDSVRNFR